MLVSSLTNSTVGLFAGVSLEGTVLIERKDANADFYGSQIPARDILSGRVPPPEIASQMYEFIEAAEGKRLPVSQLPTIDNPLYSPIFFFFLNKCIPRMVCSCRWYAYRWAWHGQFKQASTGGVGVIVINLAEHALTGVLHLAMGLQCFGRILGPSGSIS